MLTQDADKEVKVYKLALWFPVWMRKSSTKIHRIYGPLYAPIIRNTSRKFESWRIQFHRMTVAQAVAQAQTLNGGQSQQGGIANKQTFVNMVALAVKKWAKI